jgi:hypothetical protein
MPDPGALPPEVQAVLPAVEKEVLLLELVALLAVERAVARVELVVPLTEPELKDSQPFL